MVLGHLKTAIVAAIAVVFGIVQLFCACLDIASAETVLPPSTSIQQLKLSNHNHQAMIDVGAQSKSPHVHGERDHEADCSHCDDSVVLAVSPDVAPRVFTTPTDFKTVFIELEPHTRADMASASLAGLHWLDPPRQFSSSNPVTLHTRSLI